MINFRKYEKLGTTEHKALYFFLHHIFISFPTILYLIWIIKYFRIEVIHNNNSIYGNIAGILAAKICRIKIVQHLRSQRPLTRTEYKIANHINVFVFPLECTKKYYSKIHNKFFVIPNCIDPEEYIVSQEKIEEAKIKYAIGSKKVILYAGSLRKEKGIEFLLESVAMMQDVKIAVIIAGTDFHTEKMYQKELQERVTTLKINNRVQFTGFVDDIKMLYAISDVVVFPTMLNEGFGRIIIEAGIMGKPVLCTNKVSLAELVSKTEGGLLFEQNDYDDFIKKLNLILGYQYGYTFSQDRVIKNTEKHFGYKHTSLKVTALYEDALVT